MADTIYLVTGGSGFLGSQILSTLLSQNKKVRTLVIPNDRARKFIPSEVEIIEGDLCKKETLENFFTVPEGTATYLIHCASMVTVNADFNQKLLDINVGGTQNIIDLCLAHPECQKMVYVGSTGAIPELPHGTKISEVDYFDKEKVVGWYSKSKAMASQLVLDACKTRNLNACIVQPTGILGPGDFSCSTTTSTLIKIMKGEMTVGMGGSFNLADVRDLADGCVNAVEKGEKGESYILGNDIVTMKQMCSILKKYSGCKTPKIYMPLRIAKSIAKKMERKAETTGKPALMTTFSVYNLERNNTFDYSKAKRVLGYKTRSYEETFRDEAVWIRENGFLN